MGGSDWTVSDNDTDNVSDRATPAGALASESGTPHAEQLLPTCGTSALHAGHVSIQTHDDDSGNSAPPLLPQRERAPRHGERRDHGGKPREERRMRAERNRGENHTGDQVMGDCD